jgi:ADP-ribose pyrophosphatase YjhB (NUDIX family)
MNTENRATVLAGGGLVENEKGEILFMFRRGKWDLPKGKLDPGETMEACAMREVREETGVENLTITGFLIITKHNYEERGMRLIKESHWYLMKAAEGQKLVPQTEEDITDLRWFPVDNLAIVIRNTYPGIIEVLKAGGMLNNYD